MRNLRKISIGIVLFIILSAFIYADSSYKVQKGDTLYSISRKYQITVAELCSANNITDKTVIKEGQKLIIPKADINNAVALNTDDSKTTVNVKTTVYTVVKGDTLYSIAKRNNMTVAELLALNNLDANTVIKVGQKLKIKDTSVKTSTETPAVATKAPDTRNYGKTVQADSSTVWPVKNPKVTTLKGKASGVQLSAAANEKVTCIREGTVMYIGVYRGFGQVIFVQSQTGIIYSYMGVNNVKVKKGDYVLFGKEIGTAGVDSISGKSQITFMVFQNGHPIDPAKAPRN
ncbi:MAG: LysM peptidoglycan-binding domain-containing protein [Treponema sp.]|nr:LysM peptidoglycan-binding domain-containing protein [Treponema sp.]